MIKKGEMYMCLQNVPLKLQEDCDLIFRKGEIYNSAVNGYLIDDFGQICKIESTVDYFLEIDTKILIDYHINKILSELNKAVEKHPKWPTNKFEQISILLEELGEVSKDLNDGRLDDARHELHQVGAMVLRTLMNWSDATK